MTEIFLEPCYDTCTAIIKECTSKETADHYGTLLDKLGAKRQEILRDAVEPKGPFNVISHNDLWSSNMLFK